MKRIAIAACLACASWPVLAPAATYNVPPDMAPAELLPGDILNYSGAYDVELPAPPATAVVNVVDTHVHFKGTIRGTLTLTRSSSDFFFAADARITASGQYSGINTAGLDRTRVELFEGASIAYVSGMDSEVFVFGGSVGSLNNAEGWTVTMLSGQISSYYDPIGYPTWTNIDVNVRGGTIGHLPLGLGSTLSLAGGEFDKTLSGYDVGFAALPGSSVHLRVQSAQLNGATIPGLVPGATVPLDVDAVQGDLTGVLSDGSPFRFDLVTDFDEFQPYTLDAVIVTAPFHSSQSQGAKVLVTLVPEPPGLILAALAAAVVVPTMGSCSYKSRAEERTLAPRVQQ